MTESSFEWERVLQSPADETFFGIGDKRNTFDPAIDHPLPGGIAKRNGTYALGVTSCGDTIWYGIADNGGCRWLSSALLPDYADPRNSKFHSYVSSKVVCGLEENNKPETRVYSFDTQTGILHRYQGDDRFRHDIKGVAIVRSAGCCGNVVFLAGLLGGGLVGGDSLRIFAIDGETKAYLGSRDLPGLNNIRAMSLLEHPDGSTGFYLAVEGTWQNYHLLRWNGERAEPFRQKPGSEYPGFEVAVDNEQNGLIANLSMHKSPEGKRYIVATTWPSPQHSGGLYFSEPMPDRGFNQESVGRMQPIMRLEDFDPDPFIGKQWMAGSLSIYQNYAYWGTIMAATAGTRSFFTHYPDAATTDANQDALVRASISRNGHLFRTDLQNPKAPVTEMLYGDESFKTYGPEQNRWVDVDNKMGWASKFGAGGFDNWTNAYTWTSTIYRDRLFIGTFDISGMIFDYVENSEYQPPEHNFYVHMAYRAAKEVDCNPGAWMVVFEDSVNPARVLSRDGFGNPNNIGFRNFVEVNGELYVGTSSSANIGDDSGYEFYRISVAEAAGREQAD